MNRCKCVIMICCQQTMVLHGISIPYVFNFISITTWFTKYTAIMESATRNTSLSPKKFNHFTNCHTTGEQNKSQSGWSNTTKQNSTPSVTIHVLKTLTRSSRLHFDHENVSSNKNKHYIISVYSTMDIVYINSETLKCLTGADSNRTCTGNLWHGGSTNFEQSEYNTVIAI